MWYWLVGGLAVLALAALLLARRRRVESGAADRLPALAAEREAGPPAALPPLARAPRREPVAPSSASVPEAQPQHVAADAARPLDLRFEPRHLSRAMVNSTLAYRLWLGNRTDAAMGPLRIGGDMISAHASLSSQDQLVPPNPLSTLHEIAGLQPDEWVELRGELRLPIASILPIGNGGERCFVPLARFRVEGSETAAAVRVFVVGLEGEGQGGTLRPFALDRGPGVERGLGQRELREA